MSAQVHTLTPGVTLHFEGDAYQVVGLNGSCVTLQRAGRRTLVQTAVLLSHPTFRIGAEKRTEAAGVGALMSNLPPDVERLATERAAHLLELTQGFPRPDDPAATDPRPEYDPALPMADRIRAKSIELGVSTRALQRWLQAYQQSGTEGLVDHRRGRAPAVKDIDPRWTDAVKQVLAEHVSRSRPTRKRVLHLVGERLRTEYGPGVVPMPGRTLAYETLREITAGTNAFRGSTKEKRSIANRPAGVYGRLTALRPGEYLLLDTTRLDVFAMDQADQRWVQLELTVAMDLCDRRITGLSLRPVSTKAADVAAVLFEAIHPRPHPDAIAEHVAYSGVPSTVIYTDGPTATPRASGSAIETIVVDHGKVFVSDHIRSVCARLGISLQPARPYTPTDKAPVERFFRTLREDLLETLPGYKGPDVYSRGADVESTAFYFIHELEAIIRGWLDEIYHQRPHRGLVLPEAPNVPISPNEMHEYALTKAGYLRVLPNPDLAFDFLPTVWRSIQHYGVELNGLRYHGDALVEYVNRSSGWSGIHRGKWPFRVDPGDIRQIYFQDPVTCIWHRINWTHRHLLTTPFALDSLRFVKQVAARTGRSDQVLEVCQEFIDRWAAGAADSRTERRVALQQALQWHELGVDVVTEPPLLDTMPRAEGDPFAAALDDPDLSDDHVEIDAANFYADALETVS